MRKIAVIALLAIVSAPSALAAEQGDKTQGQRDFGAVILDRQRGCGNGLAIGRY